MATKRELLYKMSALTRNSAELWRPPMSKIKVLSREVTVLSVKDEDYISLTDIARYKDPDRTDYVILNWLRNRNTIEFLGIWEHLNNPGFNPIEFDGIKKQDGLAVAR